MALERASALFLTLKSLFGSSPPLEAQHKSKSSRPKAKVKHSNTKIELIMKIKDSYICLCQHWEREKSAEPIQSFVLLIVCTISRETSSASRKMPLESAVRKMCVRSREKLSGWREMLSCHSMKSEFSILIFPTSKRHVEIESERGRNAEQVVEDDMMGSSCWLLFLLKWKCCSSQSTIGITHVVHFDIFTHLKIHAIPNWASKTKINSVTNEIEDFPVDTNRNLFAYAVMRWYTNVFPFFVIQSPKISEYISLRGRQTLFTLWMYLIIAVYQFPSAECYFF